MKNKNIITESFSASKNYKPKTVAVTESTRISMTDESINKVNEPINQKIRKTLLTKKNKPIKDILDLKAAGLDVDDGGGRSYAVKGPKTSIALYDGKQGRKSLYRDKGMRPTNINQDNLDKADLYNLLNTEPKESRPYFDEDKGLAPSIAAFKDTKREEKDAQWHKNYHTSRIADADKALDAAKKSHDYDIGYHSKQIPDAEAREEKARNTRASLMAEKRAKYPNVGKKPKASEESARKTQLEAYLERKAARKAAADEAAKPGKVTKTKELKPEGLKVKESPQKGVKITSEAAPIGNETFKTSDGTEVSKRDFQSFVKVQYSGVTNMFDRRTVMDLANISREVYSAIISGNNYTEMKDFFGVDRDSVSDDEEYDDMIDQLGYNED